MNRVWCFLFAVVLGACPGSGEESLAPGEDVRLEGRVTEVDPTPMFVDGDGLIHVESDEHGDVLVRIPARERLCEARGLDVFPSLDAGDRVRARGRVTAPGKLSVCADETHFLERSGQGGAGPAALPGSGSAGDDRPFP